MTFFSTDTKKTTPVSPLKVLLPALWPPGKKRIRFLFVLSAVLLSFNFELTNPADAGEKHAYMVPIIPATGHLIIHETRITATHKDQPLSRLALLSSDCGVRPTVHP